jgi:hypothetical protein
MHIDNIQEKKIPIFNIMKIALQAVKDHNNLKKQFGQIPGCLKNSRSLRTYLKEGKPKIYRARIEDAQTAFRLRDMYQQLHPLSDGEMWVL